MSHSENSARTVLLVEDHFDIRTVLTEALEFEGYRNTPVIVLSAHAEASGVRDADAFMRKPPDLDRLMEWVGHYFSV